MQKYKEIGIRHTHIFYTASILTTYSTSQTISSGFYYHSLFISHARPHLITESFYSFKVQTFRMILNTGLKIKSTNIFHKQRLKPKVVLF
jgi:hypothetical protein